MRTGILRDHRIRCRWTVCVFGVASAEAATGRILGEGLWGPGTPTTSWSRPDSVFSFSLTLPNPISDNPTTEVKAFHYTLAGTEVSDKLFSSMQVQFFLVGHNMGLFDLIFPSDGDVVSLYGEDIGGPR